MGKAARKNRKQLLPIATIVAAVSGDDEALCAVVHHYDHHITKLATRKMTTQEGTQSQYVDEELKQRLVTKLIAGILKFRLDD